MERNSIGQAAFPQQAAAVLTHPRIMADRVPHNVPSTVFVIAGKPLRETLAPFLTAFLAGALAADLAALALGNPLWAYGGLWLLGAGALAAASATALGLVEFLGVPRDGPTGWRLFGNTGLVALIALIDFYLRCERGPAGGPAHFVWLTVVAVLLLFLGGRGSGESEAPSADL